MEFLGVKLEPGPLPELDPAFLPLYQFNRAFLRGAKEPVGIAVERAGGETAVCRTFLHGAPAMYEADCYYLLRLVKTLLWSKGGFRVAFQGGEAVFDRLRRALSPGGELAFDREYMERVFERPFELFRTEALPPAKETPMAVGGHLKGCRIGFDAGGSDRKVSAVIDGETVYSEEVVWFPKQNADPDYHYRGIVSALKAAAAHLPRVDAVGVSSAGIFINNRTMVASLFLQVPPELFESQVKDIYIRAVRDCFGPVPLSVVNDGDVTALAGAMSLGEGNILGIAMGTSEAGGFVDANGCVTGWLNELAFIPVDANPAAARDEWSGDTGCGVKYFSQDAVIRLAPAAGIALAEELTPAGKLKAVQALMEAGDERAAAIYRSIGVYLAHSLALYHSLYGFDSVLLLGRVMSGRGGDTLLESCRRALASGYPELSGRLRLALPDERFRRVGQSAAAASLPELKA